MRAKQNNRFQSNRSRSFVTLLMTIVTGQYEQNFFWFPFLCVYRLFGHSSIFYQLDFFLPLGILYFFFFLFKILKESIHCFVLFSSPLNLFIKSYNVNYEAGSCHLTNYNKICSIFIEQIAFVVLREKSRRRRRRKWCLTVQPNKYKSWIANNGIMFE